MRDQETTTRSVGRRGSGRSPGVFHQAVAALQAEHRVAELVAYEMLVDGAVQAGTSVRDVAQAVVARSAPTG